MSPGASEPADQTFLEPGRYWTDTWTSVQLTGGPARTYDSDAEKREDPPKLIGFGSQLPVVEGDPLVWDGDGA